MRMDGMLRLLDLPELAVGVRIRALHREMADFAKALNRRIQKIHWLEQREGTLSQLWEKI